MWGSNTQTIAMTGGPGPKVIEKIGGSETLPRLKKYQTGKTGRTPRNRLLADNGRESICARGGKLKTEGGKGSAWIG